MHPITRAQGVSYHRPVASDGPGTSQEVEVWAGPYCSALGPRVRCFGGVPCAVRALCEKLAVLHHREFGKFRRLKGCH